MMEPYSAIETSGKGPSLRRKLTSSVLNNVGFELTLRHLKYIKRQLALKLKNGEKSGIKTGAIPLRGQVKPWTYLKWPREKAN